MRLAWPLLAASLLAAAAAAAQPASRGSPSQAASRVAEAMQAQLPVDSNGIVMRRVHADGDLLVVTVELPATATEQNHIEYVSGFMSGTCQTRPNPLFENGIRLRIDTYPTGGTTRQSEVFTRCPSPAS